ncbi:hypothetical protein ACP70R_010645 [Stipagrostis hirtigluma subsp. patula]
MAAAGDAPPIVDRDVWLACAVPLSRLPAVGDQVYYFPHGHAEQCPAHLPSPLPGPPLFLCTVTALRLAADTTSNEVFAAISLQPGGRAPAPPPPQPQAPQPPHQLSYFAKQLTQSDANNGGGFSVPRYCADYIFPRLDFDADPPVQTLRMRDPCGAAWAFRHIYRGTPRRHLLTTGWSKFVNAKLLVAGDTVVFMRRPDGDLLIGLRRAPRYPPPSPDPSQAPPRNARARVPPEDVLEAARLAAEGSPFTVTYYPRQGAAEFVVPRKEVEDALTTRWEPGMQVRMPVMEAEDARRTDWANGTIKALHSSIWRALEIEWDDSTPSSLTKTRYVNTWQVQFVGFPPLMKRLRISETIESMAAPLIGPESQEMAILLGAPIPAGMQGARHDGPTHVPSAMITTQQLFPMDVQMPVLPALSSGSEILDPEIGSPPNNSVNMQPSDLPEETRSIQLFGTTITPQVEQSADSGAPKEVNEPPNGVADETVEEDV